MKKWYFTTKCGISPQSVVIPITNSSILLQSYHKI